MEVEAGTSLVVVLALMFFGSLMASALPFMFQIRGNSMKVVAGLGGGLLLGTALSIVIPEGFHSMAEARGTFRGWQILSETGARCSHGMLSTSIFMKIPIKHGVAMPSHQHPHLPPPPRWQRSMGMPGTGMGPTIGRAPSSCWASSA